MIRLWRSLVVVALAASLSSLLTSDRARAEDPPPAGEAAPVDPVKALAGTWEFSNAERDQRCMLKLAAEPAAVGMRIEFEPACLQAFPFLKDVAGWTFAENDFLRLVDASGAPQLEFSEVESGLFEAPRPGEGVLFIQAAAAVGPPPPALGQMIGEWTVMRGVPATPICRISLLADATTPDLHQLTLKPGCNALITEFRPVGWRMDRGELVLVSARNETWRFEENDPRNWQRVPEQRVPLSLVKQ